MLINFFRAFLNIFTLIIIVFFFHAYWLKADAETPELAARDRTAMSFCHFLRLLIAPLHFSLLAFLRYAAASAFSSQPFFVASEASSHARHLFEPACFLLFSQSHFQPSPFQPLITPPLH
jgi:hypothetical protein